VAAAHVADADDADAYFVHWISPHWVKLKAIAFGTAVML
jgi:hypothetical protein